jgi:hypothetical protein
MSSPLQICFATYRCAKHRIYLSPLSTLQIAVSLSLYALNDQKIDTLAGTRFVSSSRQAWCSCYILDSGQTFLK